MIKQIVRKFVPSGVVHQLYHLPLALGANLFYGFPSSRLKIIGITGSDGKTTTATLTHKILTDSGKKAALISTVCAKIGSKEIPTGFHVTTPDPWMLQKLIKFIVDEGYEYLVLETTSHGLDQYRLFGINFMIGVITNITHEHLDYHKTLTNYRKAKSKLFEQVKYAILNKDDSSYEFLLSRVNPEAKIITYAIKSEADFTLQKFSFKTLLPGQYNLYNCLAAIAVAVTLGINKQSIVKSIIDFQGVEGRMEEINEGQKFRVIVDFAHTPNALENALLTLRSQIQNEGRLISVFGCAGLRDIQKRWMMGEISGRIADFSIFTAEDPRTEDVNLIIEQMATGARKNKTIEIVDKLLTNNKQHFFIRKPDRQEAIEYAINKIAKKNDIIGIFGKGHEQSMCFGTKESLWNDRIKTKEILKKYLRK